MYVHPRPPLRPQKNYPIHKPNAVKKQAWGKQSKCLRLIRDGTLGGLRYFQLYLATCCNHCYVYLVKNGLTWFERIFWFILIALAHFASIHVATKSIDRFLTKNAYMGIERNYFSWNTSLPSLTICPMERLDKELFDDYCRSHGIDAVDKIVLWNFLENLANSTYMNFKSIPVHPSLDAILDRINLKPRKYMETIYNLTSEDRLNPDESHRIRCIDNDQYIHTRQVLTEYGLCYMANNLVDERYSSKYLLFGSLPEPNKYELEHNMLTIQLGSFPDRYKDYTFIGFRSPIDLYAHSVHEVMKVDNNFGYSTENLYYEPLAPEITTAENFETDATIRQRNCRFSHESNLPHFPVYTKNICMQECRLQLVYKMCKCIPHFYPNRIKNPKRVCDYKALRECLPQHESYFLKLYRTRSGSNELELAPCDCDQSCKGNVLSFTLSVYNRSKQLYGSYGATMAVKSWPTFRYKREIYMTFTDLLVYIGGTAGFFLGFSVLGAIEIVYFFTMRLVFTLLGYKL
ncbi:pickpocket 10 [Haematobia irritans]|uniref:pickpocket 10 n=1 Tax=Haematobia irritans TaxID=7368 RepID=UPI003F4FD65D